MRRALAAAAAAFVALAGTAVVGSAPAEARPAAGELRDLRIADEPPPPPPPRQPPPPPPPPHRVEKSQPRPPGSHKLGFRFGGGLIPIDQQAVGMMALALGIERPLAGRFRWLAEYELLWLLPPRTAEEQMRGAPSFEGSGHRLHVGLRRALLSKQLGVLRLFVDAEAGGGAALALTLAPSATRVLPHAFAGIRLGYELSARTPTSGRTSTWEPTLTFRALALPDGPGFLAGLSMSWGS